MISLQRLNFVDVATGSLDQGLRCAGGMAYTGKLLDKTEYMHVTSLFKCINFFVYNNFKNVFFGNFLATMCFTLLLMNQFSVYMYMLKPLFHFVFCVHASIHTFIGSIMWRGSVSLIFCVYSTLSVSECFVSSVMGKVLSPRGLCAWETMAFSSYYKLDNLAGSPL